MGVFSGAGQHVEHDVNSIRERGSDPTGNKTACMHTQVWEELRVKVPAGQHIYIYKKKKSGNPDKNRPLHNTDRMMWGKK